MSTELDEARQDLADVLDECRVLEGELDAVKKERDQLKVQLQRASVTAPAPQIDKKMLAARFETMKKALEQSALEKSVLQKEIESLRRQNNEPFRPSSEQLHALQHERDESHRLRMQLERIEREYASKELSLQSEVDELKAVLQQKDAELIRAQAASRQSVEDQVMTHVSKLQEQNDALKMEVARLQLNQSLSGGGSGVSVTPLRSTPKQHQQQADTEERHVLRANVANLEMTVHALNTELKALEDRIAELQRQHLEQRRRWVDDLETERQRNHDERMECDLIVHKMTEELERLIQENQELKQQHRMTTPHFSSY